MRKTYAAFLTAIGLSVSLAAGNIYAAGADLQSVTERQEMTTEETTQTEEEKKAEPPAKPDGAQGNQMPGNGAEPPAKPDGEGGPEGGQMPGNFQGHGGH